MKKILSITGTRADYGILTPVFQAIEASDALELGVVVTGMHLREAFGNTVECIRRDGFPIIAELDTLNTEDSPEATAEYIGKTMQECARVFAKEKPDVVLLMGDRGEQLAGAVAAAYLGITVAHLHGGEKSGMVDDRVRNAITQLADIHFTSAENHAEAVRCMCPNAKHVYVTGAPALDIALSITPQPKKELLEEMGFDSTYKTVVFVQHPDFTDSVPIPDQLSAALDALRSFEGNILILGSNADPGGYAFNKTLQEFAEKRPHTTFRMSISQEQYFSWLNAADVLVGNSSSGIIEAASFQLAVVNIGRRQQGRLRSNNVLDVPYGKEAIRSGLQKALHDEEFHALIERGSNVYEKGGASAQIVQILAENA